MAFRRSRTGYRRSYRRRSRVSGGGFSTVRRYRRLQPRVIRSAPLRVVHYRIVSATAAFPSTAGAQTGSRYLLNPVPRGTSIYERLGNRVQNLSLVISGEIKFNPFRTAFDNFTSSGAVSSQVQLQQDMALIVAYCPDRKADYPNLSEYYAIDASGFYSTWSLPRVDAIPQMKILYRKDYQFKTVEAHAGTAGHNYIAPSALRRVKIKLPLNLRTTYVDDITGEPVVGEIEGGSLYLFLLGDYGTDASPPYGYNRPVLNFETRLAFTNLD